MFHTGTKDVSRYVKNKFEPNKNENGIYPNF